jgi:hypothetical protein
LLSRRRGCPLPLLVQVPPFLYKTFNLVSDAATDAIVSWAPDGLTFTVWKPDDMVRSGRRRRRVMTRGHCCAKARRCTACAALRCLALPRARARVCLCLPRHARRSAAAATCARWRALGAVCCAALRTPQATFRRFLPPPFAVFVS